jgi:hypothetical protein
MSVATSTPDVTSDYLFSAYSPGGALACASRVMQRITQLKKEGKLGRVDAVAVRGTSGLLIGPMVAAFLDKSLIVVRREDGAHCKRKVEGNRNIRSYIVVDDYVCTGSTIQIIKREVDKFVTENPLNPIPELLAVFTYEAGDDTFVRTERRIDSENYAPVYNCAAK